MRRVIRDKAQYLNRLRRDDTKDAVKNVMGVTFQWAPSLTTEISSSINGTTGVITETPVDGGTRGVTIYGTGGTAGFGFPTISGTTGVS
jgi:hypothetical protein